LREPAMTKIVLTYEDYLELPDDGKRYELHEGELSVTPAPGLRHQRLLLRLTRILGDHVDAIGQGELMIASFDCIFSNTTIVQPDLMWVDESRRGRLTERGCDGAPTLAVEIISPYSGRIDRRRKMTLYADHDVTWYWIVDPEARRIEAYLLNEGAYRLEAAVDGPDARALPPFPGLALDPATIWS
jgi:Uma2 family endonuclease